MMRTVKIESIDERSDFNKNYQEILEAAEQNKNA